MKPIACLLLAGLLAPAPSPRQAQEEPAKRTNPVTRFFEAEGERLARELEGSWMLLDYTDPLVSPDAGSASGFAAFHSGFLTWMLAIDSATQSLLGLSEFLILESAAYRYRVDDQASLQLAAVMGFSNNTESGDVERDPSGIAFEYFARIEDGVLELRDPDGVVLTFRKVEAGDFPDSAIRKIEKQRSRTEWWEDAGDEER
jgi:hypothetical protein